MKRSTRKARTSLLPGIGLLVGVLLVAQACVVLTVVLVSSKQAKANLVALQQQEQRKNSRTFLSVKPRPLPNISFTLLQRTELRSRTPPDENKVQRTVDLYFETFARKRQAMFSVERVAEERAIWQHFYNLIRSIAAPPEQFRARTNTRGVVMSCGGKYFALCLSNLKVLIELHRIALPVEVWYSQGELEAEQEQELVAMRNRWGSPRLRLFNDVVPGYQLWLGQTMAAPTNIGTKAFHVKLMAIVGSAFAEVLWLDADNTCARNPAYLFETPEFRTTGALFWPDMYALSERSLAWEALGIASRQSWAMESGQLLIDKTRCWRELFVAALFNQRQEFWYSAVNGDKDTFLLSWMATGQPYSMVPFPPMFAGTGRDINTFCGNSFVQADPSGRPLFVHAVGAKGISSSTLVRKWEGIKMYDVERAVPVYRWSGACIDAIERPSASSSAPSSAGPVVQVVPFTSVLGNLEDALHFFVRTKEPRD